MKKKFNEHQKPFQSQQLSTNGVHEFNHFNRNTFLGPSIGGCDGSTVGSGGRHPSPMQPPFFVLINIYKS